MRCRRASDIVRMRCLASIAIIVAFAGAGCKDARTGNGQSSANEVPVPDGHVILLKRNSEVAAFILRNQKCTPEQTDFTWYYRTDGKGTFSAGDPAVSTGTVSNTKNISFATFSLDWSMNADGKGWVYFSVSPTEFDKAGDFGMCVTKETDIAKIDALDRRWKYRDRPRVNVRALIKSQLNKEPLLPGPVVPLHP